MSKEHYKQIDKGGLTLYEYGIVIGFFVMTQDHATFQLGATLTITVNKKKSAINLEEFRDDLSYILGEVIPEGSLRIVPNDEMITHQLDINSQQ